MLEKLAALTAVAKEIQKSVGDLTEVARKNKESAVILAEQVEVVKELAATNQQNAAEERARMLQILGHLESNLAVGMAANLRVEEQQHQVADDLSLRDANAQAAGPEPGEAADSAAKGIIQSDDANGGT